MTSADQRHAAFQVDDFVRVDAATDPSFSADGRSIVFLANRSGAAQVYVTGIEGEAKAPARRLTETEGIVYGASVRPGRDEVLFVTDDGGDEQWQLNLMRGDGSEVRALKSEPGVIYNFGAWSHDGARVSYACNRRDRRFSDLYVLDVDSGKETLVLQKDLPGMRAGAFSPDGSRLLAAWPNIEVPGDNNLYLLDVTGGEEPRCITPHAGVAEWLIPSTGQTGPAARFAGDGVVLALSDEGREFVGLQRIDLESDQRDYILTFDWDVEAFALSADRRRLAAVVNEDGYSRLALYELDDAGLPGSELPVPQLPRGTIAGPAWSPDGKLITFSLVSARMPASIWLIDVETGEARQVSQSDMHGLSASDLPEPELIRYTSFDGRQIPAFFYRPKVVPSGGMLPCIVLVHGGPESQSRPDLWGRYAAPAYLLARGDLCLLVPNVRGSTGYGKEYSHADDVEKRMDSVRDLLHAVEWLAGSGLVDPARIGVMGGSYGGFMTLAAITEAPERWAAAVDMFGIANWETFMERTGPWRRAQRAREYGSDPAFLRSISPIHWAGAIRCPLMVVQGDHDVRVPPEESEQIAEAVRRNEGVVQYEVFEREGHGIQRLPNRLRMNRLIVEFLEQHLIGRAKD